MNDKLLRRRQVEIVIDVIIHATEDVRKFYKSFEESFNIKKEQFTIQELTGHFDNPIIMLDAKITKEKDATRIIEKLSSDMSKEQKKEILESFDQRIDRSRLYIRLDKQEFVQGYITLGEKNSIKLKIYTPIYKKKEIIQEYQTLLGFN